MQPEIATRITIARIARKEITLFFAAPVAWLFLAAFAAITLFVFFWGEAFFARNIADVRPLFEWMPVFLIFLCATLTMRMWSEERRSGTLEHVLTQSVPLWHFVAGKFVACLSLLVVALLVTLPLPITVDLLGDLDWGPVLAGYLATLLLGAAYLSIGLFISGRSDNQIVSLISASALSGAIYLLGTRTITDLVGTDTGEWLRLLGTGSRFDAITRGVIDLRDLYYYLSIVLVFLAWNTLALEQERWAGHGGQPHHRRWRLATGLLIANAVAANLWLGQISALRIDTTEGNQYSLSEATRSYLDHLQEPLLLRGYFSATTHPLLAPLVPQMRDLLREYKIAGKGKVRVEFVDPLTSAEAEQEANQKYGIQPVPFQVADRYESSIVSSYFDVLVQYGDQHQVLDFRDLIEIRARNESDIDVQLRNPEFDLTHSIKKVLHSYQSAGNLFDTVKSDLQFNAYVSTEDHLPKQLAEFRQTMTAVLDEVAQKAGGRLQVNLVDPDANGGEVGRQIADDYGFRPMSTNLFSDQRFYFYMTLTAGDQVVQIPLDDMSRASFERNLEAGVRRFSRGFTKTVALVTPEDAGPYGTGGPSFSHLQTLLGSDLNLNHEDLSDGSVAGDADILLLAAPHNLDDKALFAVDQFLMKGGTVIALTSPYSASISPRDLSLQPYASGIDKWLAFQGLKVENQVVMDQQNAAFPVPVTRNVAGLQLQELRMLDYPYFIDVRRPGLNPEHPITGELPQATLAWASPITVEIKEPGQRQITELLRSSDRSWLSNSLDIMPQVGSGGLTGYQPSGAVGSHLLGVISTGVFDSWFAGKESPLLTAAAPATDKATGAGESASDSGPDKAEAAPAAEELQIGSVIEHSPEAARIILISSNDFLRDQVLQLAGAAGQTEYLGTLQLAANALDWSLEDELLLGIRSRGHFNRTLPPMAHGRQLFWEYLNYGLAATALAAIALIERRRRHLQQRRYFDLLAR